MSTILPALDPAVLLGSLTAQWKYMLKQFAFKLRCAIPAIVQSFDADNQTVSVQIAVSELIQFQNGPQWTQIPVINNVPLLYCRGGGYSVTVPVAAGDEGMLIFCDACIDLWWQNSGVQPPAGAAVVQPQFERRRHDLTDCGFFPGMSCVPIALQNYSTDSLQIRSDDGTEVIDVSTTNGISITGTKITIQSNGNMLLAATGQVIISSGGDDTEIDNSDYLEHTHSGVTTGSGDSGPVNPDT